jgi:hypothetical protein
MRGYLTLHSSQEHLLEHAFKWSLALTELKTLMPRTWVEGPVLDFFLLTVFNSVQNPASSVRYLHLDLLRYDNPSDLKIQGFRETYSLPPIGECPLVTVVGVIWAFDHFFAAVFSPEHRHVHLLGRYISSELGHTDESTNWKSWRGPELWKKICKLHGWNVLEMKVTGTSWPQNGYDCGPITGHVLEHIIKHGFVVDQDGMWLQPELPCGHLMRREMAVTVHLSCTNARRRYLELVGHNPAMVDILESPTDGIDFDHSIQTRAFIKPTLDMLNKTISTCRYCRSQLDKGKTIHNNLNTLHTGDTAGIFKKYPSLKGSRKFVQVEDDLVEEEKIEEEDDEGEEVVKGLNCQVQEPDEQRYSRISRKPVKDWNEARLGRFPRPCQPPELPPLDSLVGLWPSFDRYFDDYEEGPTLEIMEPPADFLPDYPLVYFANKIVEDPWELFKDYGWRTMTSFSHMFHLRNPVTPLEHILPVGLPPPNEDDHIPNNITRKYSLTRSGEEVDINVDNVQIMGAAEMLAMAGLPGSPESHSVLVRGRTPEERYIHVNLELDCQNPKTVDIGLDVDSLIWVGHTLKTCLAIKVHATPNMGKRPPIYNHNHTYVELLVPRSEEDKDMGKGRSEWWTKSFPFSNIPHVHFGSVGDGSGTLNIYMALPRLTHKHQYKNR